MNKIKVLVWEPGRRIRGAKLQVIAGNTRGVTALFNSYLKQIGYQRSAITLNDWKGYYIHHPIAVVWLTPNAIMGLKGHPSWRRNEAQAGMTSLTINIYREIQRTIDSPLIIFNVSEVDLTDMEIGYIYDRLDPSCYADNHA